MATVKEKKPYVEVFYLKKGKCYISRKEMPASEFNLKEIKENVCGHRTVKRRTKNGVPEGPKEWDGIFVCVNSSIMSKEELEKKQEMYRVLIDSMGDNFTHALFYNKRIYFLDLKS